MCVWGWNPACRLIAICLLPTAIHQRRHALLHPDQDEWQRERRRERTNPHPRLPQDRPDAALHEPHRQHGTGCLRHVIVTWLCWRRGIGRVGQETEHKTLNDLQNHGCPVWPIYSPGCRRARLEQDFTYCQNALSRKKQNKKKYAPSKPQTETRNVFFKINGCLTKRYLEGGGTEGKCAAIKKPSPGACFLNFLQCSFTWGEKKKKKNCNLRCDACAVPFQWSCWH